MAKIRPVSDLRNCNDELKVCESEAPVYLTKKDQGKDIIMTIEDNEKLEATNKLLSQLIEGEKSFKDEALISSGDILKELGLEEQI